MSKGTRWSLCNKCGRPYDNSKLDKHMSEMHPPKEEPVKEENPLTAKDPLALDPSLFALPSSYYGGSMFSAPPPVMPAYPSDEESRLRWVNDGIDNTLAQFRGAKDPMDLVQLAEALKHLTDARENIMMAVKEERDGGS